MQTSLVYEADVEHIIIVHIDVIVILHTDIIRCLNDIWFEMASERVEWRVCFGISHLNAFNFLVFLPAIFAV